MQERDTKLRPKDDSRLLWPAAVYRTTGMLSDTAKRTLKLTNINIFPLYRIPRITEDNEVINSEEQSPSWEANNCSAVQEFTRILWKP